MPSSTSMYILGDSRVIMSPTELKMQPTIHLERKLDMNAVYI
jgi:hypothetical protein